MPITIDLAPADAEFLAAQAAARHVSVEEFSREAVMKAARNAAYLAGIDRAIKNLDEGKGKFFTDAELEELFHGNTL